MQPWWMRACCLRWSRSKKSREGRSGPYAVDRARVQRQRQRQRRPSSCDPQHAHCYGTGRNRKPQLQYVSYRPSPLLPRLLLLLRPLTPEQRSGCVQPWHHASQAAVTVPL